MDEQTRAFLDAAAADPAPPPGSVPLEEFRAAVAGFKSMGDTPSWCTLGQDYVLTKEQMEWAIDQYAPGVERTEPLLSPVCAPNRRGSISGGGWSSGPRGRSARRWLLGEGPSGGTICRQVEATERNSSRLTAPMSVHEPR